MSDSPEMTEAQLADFYGRTHDLSEFDQTQAQPLEVRRAVTISVRFSEEEIAALRRKADAAGLKVTAFIRGAALDADHPVDRAAVALLAARVEQQAHELRAAVAS